MHGFVFRLGSAPVLIATLFLAAAAFERVSFGQDASAAPIEYVNGPMEELSFPPGKSQVTLKLECVGGVLRTSDASVNGLSGIFAIDTGDNGYEFDPAIESQLKQPVRWLISDGLPVKVVDVNLGGATIRNVPFSKYGPKAASTALIGSIGDDLLSHCPFCIDYRALRMTLYSPKRFTPPSGGMRYQLLRNDQSICGKIPQWSEIRLKIGSQSVNAMLDTGQSFTLALYPDFCLGHPETVDRARGYLSGGIPFFPNCHDYNLRSGSFNLFGHRYSVANQPGALWGDSPLPPGDFPDAGVGTLALRDFRLTFDLQNQQVWVERQPYLTVQEQLRNGLDPNAPDLDGNPPLILAAAQGDIDGFDTLIEAGASLRKPGSKGASVLEAAAGGGCPVILKKCLDSRLFDVDARDDDGNTALMAAMPWPDCACAKILLADGADPNLASKDGKTSLRWAIDSDNLPGVQLLLDHGATVNRPDKDGVTAVADAYGETSPAILDLLLAHGGKFGSGRNVDVGSEGITPLADAALSGNDEMVQYLLQERGGTKWLEIADDEGRTPLMLAAAKGFPTVVKLLMDTGANVSARAAKDVDNSALHYAAYEGNTRTIAMLLNHGALVDAQNAEGITPLMLASESDQFGAVETLLHANAKVDAVDKRGQTALIYACGNDALPCAWELIHSGANVNALSADDGLTPLGAAVYANSAPIIGLLLHHGADRNAKCGHGFAPLEMAVSLHKRNAVAVLMYVATTQPVN